MKCIDVIDDFLHNGKEVVIDMEPIDGIEKILQSRGFDMEELDDNTNGWDVDFWYDFVDEFNTKIQLSGSLWYGGFKLTKE
jgi:hypothetical protein